MPVLYLGAALLIDELVLRRAGLASASLLALGVVLKLSTLAYAWVFVFTSCRDERSKLAARWARLRFIADAFKLEDGEESAQRSTAAAAVTAAAARAVPSARGGAPSSASSMPASLATSAAIISSHADASADGEAATFGPERAKERLLSGFATATAVYVCVIAVAAVVALWDQASWVRHPLMELHHDVVLTSLWCSCLRWCRTRRSGASWRR